jgi:hypothetical protein
MRRRTTATTPRTNRIQGDHADQQECEHHQGSAALTVAVSPCDHNSGNGPMFDLSNLRLLCQSHHHRIERELKRERHDHQRPPKIIF